jgi:pimeloyl-ACP methyl ester carboxylesterase
MDAIDKVMQASAGLGQQITEAKGWRGDLATVHGAKRHPSGFSQHFVDFCAARGAAGASFLKAGRAGFGGFTDGPVRSNKRPVVLIHGNGCDATAMAPLIRELMDRGYAPHDIYALSYGKGDPQLVHSETHAPKYAQTIRTFLEAVRDYTGRSIDVVAHSKGVTDAQLAIHGMTVSDQGAVERFAQQLPVEGFYGAAGANQGLSACSTLPFLAVASRNNGFHPEALVYSVLDRLPKVARKVYALIAVDDDLEKDEIKTARVRHQDGMVVLPSGGHMAPIWQPKALVDLMTGRSRLVSSDGYERIRASAKTAPNALSSEAFTDAMVLASSYFMSAGRDLSDQRGALTRASCGFATLIHAANCAMEQLRAVPFDMMSSFAGLPNSEDAAIAGTITTKVRELA